MKKIEECLINPQNKILKYDSRLWPNSLDWNISSRMFDIVMNTRIDIERNIDPVKWRSISSILYGKINQKNT